jgi:dCTP deaminase
MFFLPNNLSAEYKTKSTMARNGLDHALAGWCDAGWNSSVLTLELKNQTRNHHIILKPGMKIGQMIFHRHEDAGYFSYSAKGSYNGDATVQAGK